ncbi:hypothetical protein [Desulfosarcina sp. BuS5]|uniref:hypothetical protein n=1 Tax=Desulfosarcina sp. BuS5 TaxID=933262 RepID=UPI0012F82C78|nr:hypothetical protein [Desulfosarcina sp. BuS5]
MSIFSHYSAMNPIVSEKIPVDVVINKLEQNQDGSFYLDGNAFTGRSIIEFNNSLSRLDRFKTTILETIKRDEASSSPRTKMLRNRSRLQAA